MPDFKEEPFSTIFASSKHPIRRKIEAQPSETKPKKMVSRNVASALTIICVILVASLGMAVVYYNSSIDSVTKDKGNIIASKEDQIGSLNSQISSQNKTISSLVTQLATLQNQTDNIHIGGTQNSTIWVNNETILGGGEWSVQRVNNETSHLLGELWNWPSFDNVSVGYIVVLVSSNISSTVAEIIQPDTDYYSVVTVGFSGIAIFAIPPTTRLFVVVGNPNGNSLQYTVTIIHCY